jgi:hypothetical protein
VTPSTTAIQIHGVNLDIVFSGASCATPTTVNLTGTLTGGAWHQAAHLVTFSADTGLTAHIPILGSAPVTVTGTIRDDEQTLVVTD